MVALETSRRYIFREASLEVDGLTPSFHCRENNLEKNKTPEGVCYRITQCDMYGKIDPTPTPPKALPLTTALGTDNRLSLLYAPDILKGGQIPGMYDLYDLYDLAAHVAGWEP